jgi:hypothetical protein
MPDAVESAIAASIVGVREGLRRPATRYQLQRSPRATGPPWTEVPIYSRPACPVCSRSVTCGPTRSSVSRPRWKRAAWPFVSPSSTSDSSHHEPTQRDRAVRLDTTPIPGLNTWKAMAPRCPDRPFAGIHNDVPRGTDECARIAVRRGSTRRCPASCSLFVTARSWRWVPPWCQAHQLELGDAPTISAVAPGSRSGRQDPGLGKTPTG